MVGRIFGLGRLDGMLGSCQGRRRQGSGENRFRACRKLDKSKEAQDKNWDVLAARGDIHDRPR